MRIKSKCLQSVIKRRVMKRLDKIANEAKKKSDALHNHAMKPDKYKLTIPELFADEKKRPQKMRTYPNMGKIKNED